jgi:hypothetical protein
MPVILASSLAVSQRGGVVKKKLNNRLRQNMMMSFKNFIVLETKTAYHDVRYGTRLGDLELERIGFFCFSIKHSTHTPYALGHSPPRKRGSKAHVMMLSP